VEKKQAEHTTTSYLYWNAPLIPHSGFTNKKYTMLCKCCLHEAIHPNSEFNWQKYNPCLHEVSTCSTIFSRGSPSIFQIPWV